MTEKRGRGRPRRPPELEGADSPVAAEVRELRARLGWSRTQVAAELGVGHNAVIRWETGRTLPKPEHLGRLRALASGTGEGVQQGH